MKDMDSNVLGGPRTWTGRFPRERFHPNHRAAADAPLVMACSLTFSAPSGALVAWFE